MNEIERIKKKVHDSIVGKWTVMYYNGYYSQKIESLSEWEMLVYNGLACEDDVLYDTELEAWETTRGTHNDTIAQSRQRSMDDALAIETKIKQLSCGNIEQQFINRN